MSLCLGFPKLLLSSQRILKKKFTHNCPPGEIFQFGIYRAPTKCQLRIHSPTLHMAVSDVLVCAFFIFQLGLSDLAQHGVCLYEIFTIHLY